MERVFARALDEAAEIGETIKRHRARIDGASRGDPRQAQPGPATQLTLADLSEDQVSQLPANAQRDWVIARERSKRRSA